MKSSLYLFVSLLLISCKPKSKLCEKISDEKYTPVQIDPKLLANQHKYIDYLHSKFHTQELNNNIIEGYQIMFYTAHGFGKEINLVYKGGLYYLSMKSIQKEGWTNYKKDHTTVIKKEDWDRFLDIIYEFDFWTEETQSKVNEGYLDGSVKYISGYRSEAKSCNKRDKHWILRANQEYDKISTLVSDIMDFEERIYSKYHD